MQPALPTRSQRVCERGGGGGRLGSACSGHKQQHIRD